MRQRLAGRSGKLRATIVLSVAASVVLIGLTMRRQHAVDAPTRLAPVVAPVEVVVGRFAVPGAGSVNTWWINTPHGVIVIDAQRDVESARAAIGQIRSLNRSVEALLITHAHPDHIGGIELFKQAFPHLPVYASQSTIQAARTDPSGWQQATRRALKERAPSTFALPDRVLANDQRLALAGITLEVYEGGPGESESSTMLFLPETGDLFTGDVVSNEVVDFFLEGRTGQWLQQLEQISQRFPNMRTVRPGHGADGPASRLINHTREYIEFYRAQTKRQLDAGEWDGRALSPTGRKAVARAVQARYPGYPAVAPIPNLIELNADAVARELAANPR
jgi:glyoxylase-like metal-dependent hydrolase (beta-lactamase superfamily II)